MTTELTIRLRPIYIYCKFPFHLLYFSFVAQIKEMMLHGKTIFSHTYERPVLCYVAYYVNNSVQ
jgi:hypothetical protein